jgi:membrane AbrB-like protein
MTKASGIVVQRSFLYTLVLGGMGGVLATYAHWPLPWMIGSLVMVLLVRCFSPLNVQPLPGGRKTGQWIVGIGIGLHFNAYVMEQILLNILPVLAGALITSAVSGVGVWIMRRGGEDRATAFFSSMAGGSAEMVNLGQRNGAKLSHVAAAQTLRVVVVVLTVPAVFKVLTGNANLEHVTAPVDWYWLSIVFFLGGGVAWLLQRFRQPNPWLFGPLLVTGVASTWFDLHIGLPFGASQAGQLLIGSSLGCFFERSFFRYAPAFLARSFIATCVMVVTAALAAAGIGGCISGDIRSLTLGMMPGGIAEMSLTAETLHLAVALVTAMQTLRILLVLFLAEPVYRWWLDRVER